MSRALNESRADASLRYAKHKFIIPFGTSPLREVRVTVSSIVFCRESVFSVSFFVARYPILASADRPADRGETLDALPPRPHTSRGAQHPSEGSTVHRAPDHLPFDKYPRLKVCDAAIFSFFRLLFMFFLSQFYDF